jgi:hypothetical protein
VAIEARNYSGRRVLWGLNLDSNPTSFAQFVGMIDDFQKVGMSPWGPNTLTIVFNTYNTSTVAANRYEHTFIQSTDSGDTWKVIRTTTYGTQVGQEVGTRPQAHHRLPNGGLLRRVNYEDWPVTVGRSHTVEVQIDGPPSTGAGDGGDFDSSGDYIALGLGAVAAQVQRFITLANGHILAFGQNFNQTAGSRSGIAYTRPLIRVSSDNAVSWSDAVQIPAKWGTPGDPTDPNPAVNCPTRMYPNEASGVELSDGSLGIMWRTGVRPWNGTDASDAGKSSRLVWMVLPKIGPDLWDWGSATFYDNPLGLVASASASPAPTCPEVRRVVIGSREVLITAFRKDQTSALSFYTSINQGQTWQGLSLPGYTPAGDEPYYAQIRIKPGSGSGSTSVPPQVHIAGHKGFDNKVGERDMGIVYHRFDLVDTGGSSVPAPPTVNPNGGTFNTSKSVSITAGSDATSIRYTTDGSTPTTSSGTLYSAPFTVSVTTTVKAIAINASGASLPTTAAFAIDVTPPPAPSFAPVAGSYGSAQSVTLSTAESGATIRYTTDGSTPTATSTAYGGPLTLNTTTTVKAVAYDAAGNASAVVTAAYTITGGPTQTGAFAARSGTVATEDTTVGASNWSSVASVLADDNTYAVATLGTTNLNLPDISTRIIVRNFGFTTDNTGTAVADTATVTTVRVGISRLRVGNQQIKDHALGLRKPDGSLTASITPDPATLAAWPSSETIAYYDITNPGLTVGDIKDAQFGVYFQARNAGTDTNAQIDRIWIDSIGFTTTTPASLSSQIVAATGSLLELASGTYSRVSLSGVDKLTTLTVKPAAGATVQINGGDFTAVSGIYFEGPIKWTGQKEVNNCHHFGIRNGCEWTGYDGVQLNVDVQQAGSHHLSFDKNTIHDATWVPSDPTLQNGPTCINFRRLVRDSTINGNTFERIYGFDALQHGGWDPGTGLPMGNNQVVGNTFTDVNKGSTLAHSDGIQLTGYTDGYTISSNTFVRTRGAIIQPSASGTPRGYHTNVVFEDNETDVSDFLLTAYNCPGIRVANNRAPNASLTSDNGGIRLNHSWDGVTDHFTENVTLIYNTSRRIGTFSSPYGQVTFVPNGNLGNVYEVAGGDYFQPTGGGGGGVIAPPVAVPGSGAFDGTVTVTLSAASGTSIRYTTNGAEPTASSTLYTTPLSFAATTILKAAAFDPTGTASTTLSATYTLNVPLPPPPPQAEVPDDGEEVVPTGTFVDDLLAAMAPWMTPELEDYLRSLASMWDEVEQFILDSDEYEGWTILLDPDRCPAKALPFLAQFVGERLPVGLSTSMAREWIKDAPNQRRGTLESVFRAAQRSLVGNRLVLVLERDGGTADRMTVVTYTQETPDPAQVLRDLQDVVPLDVNLVYQTLVGQPWSSVRASYATWNAVRSSFSTWGKLMTSQSGGALSGGRPRPTP